MNDVFKALADPTRREILHMVARQPSTVNQISNQFDISRPAISRHLKVMSECNLIAFAQDSRDARERNCYAQPEALHEVQEYLSKLEMFWSNRLDSLDSYLNDQKK